MDFETAYLENRSFLFRYLLKLSGSSSTAEELTQETFFRAYINWNRLQDPAKAPVWLCSIARNTYFAWYNTQKKHLPLEQALPLTAEDPAQLLLQKELTSEALSCLSALAEPYREVFQLAVFAGLSLKQISSVFGKNESWARVTYYRARQKLSESMRSKL